MAREDRSREHDALSGLPDLSSQSSCREGARSWHAERAASPTGRRPALHAAKRSGSLPHALSSGAASRPVWPFVGVKAAAASTLQTRIGGARTVPSSAFGSERPYRRSESDVASCSCISTYDPAIVTGLTLPYPLSRTTRRFAERYCVASPLLFSSVNVAYMRRMTAAQSRGLRPSAKELRYARHAGTRPTSTPALSTTPI